MASPTRKSSENLRDGGEPWFYSFAYWLLPLRVAISIGSIPHPVSDSPPISGLAAAEDDQPRIATRAEAEALTAEIRRKVQELSNAEAQLYNAQPTWNLKQLKVRRSDEIFQILDEFLKKVRDTSAEYCWPMSDPGERIQWRVHGWKHICYQHILEFWREDRSGFVPAVSRVLALGDMNQIQMLFSAAARRDPEAVGIIWSQFPNPEDHKEILEDFFSPDERPSAPQPPSELASELVDIIFAKPSSDEASIARKSLLKLISVSVTQGSKSKKGRPKTRVAQTTLRLLYKMSYSLATQVFELNSFISKYPELERERQRTILEAYPWISKIEDSLMDLLSYEPNNVALKIVGHVTGITPSSLEKMRFRSSD